jgi:DNA-directed RNA polymerase subunit M/transcription elongation factor TFIIS
LADNDNNGNHDAMTPRSRKWCAVANLELSFWQQMLGEVGLANASVGAGLAVEKGTCPVCRSEGVGVHLVNLGNIDGQSVVSLMCEDCYAKWQQAVQPYKTSNEGQADATE